MEKQHQENQSYLESNIELKQLMETLSVEILTSEPENVVIALPLTYSISSLV
jgi:hypothetical protein